MISNFNNKITREINFDKKVKICKRTIRLNKK